MSMIVIISGFCNVLVELQKNILLAEYSTSNLNANEIIEAVKKDDAYILMHSLALLFSAFAMVSGVSSITSILSINMGEKTRTFAILSTIGANNKHKIAFMVFEVLILSITSLPLGLLIGTLVLYPLTQYLNGIVSDFVELPALSFLGDNPILYCVLILLMGFVTVVLASMKPSINLLKKSPIEIARTYDAINISFKESFFDRWLIKKFGTNAKLAVANYINNKGKYRKLSLSVSACSMFFILAALFQAYMMQLESNQSNESLLSAFSTVFVYFIVIIFAVSLFSASCLFYMNYTKRKPEFAVLKSIGIENKSLNRMIAIEAIYYGIYMLVFVMIGAIIGNAALYAILSASNNRYVFIYPWKEVLISAFVIMVITFFLSQIMMNIVKRISIVSELKEMY